MAGQEVAIEFSDRHLQLSDSKIGIKKYQRV